MAIVDKGCGIVGRGFHKETFDGVACVLVKAVVKFALEGL
jgi:hypothetical protein